MPGQGTQPQTGWKGIDKEKLLPEEKMFYSKLQGFRHDLAEFRHTHHNSLTLSDVGRFSEDLQMICQQQLGKSNNGKERGELDQVVDQLWMYLYHLWAAVAGVGEQLYPVYTQLTCLERELVRLDASIGFSHDDDLLPLVNRFAEIKRQLQLQEHKQQEQEQQQQQQQGIALTQAVVHRIERLLSFMTANATTVRPELCDLHAELSAIASRLKTEQLSTLQIDQITARLAQIDQSRLKHSGLFHVEPKGQASTLGLLFACFESILAFKAHHSTNNNNNQQQQQQLLVKTVQLASKLHELAISRRFDCPVDLLRQYERELDEIYSSQANSSPNWPIIRNLVKCHHAILSLLLGIEVVSESLVSLYELAQSRLSKILDLQRKALYGKCVPSVLEALKQEIIAMQNTKINGVFYGDASDPQLLDLVPPPTGQTIINCLLREALCRIDETFFLAK